MNMKPIINNIKWDRIWIHFYISNLPSNSSVYISSLDGKYIHPLKVTEDNPHIYLLNITNPGNCKMLPTGIFKLVYKGNEPNDNFISIDETEISDIRSFNKQFIYFHKERAYRVQFTSSNGFKLKSSDVKLNNISVTHRIISIIRRLRNDSAKAVLRSIYNIQYRFYHKHNKSNTRKSHLPYILLMSDQSEQMGSNMSALKNALIRKGYRPHTALRAITTKHYSLHHWIKTLSKIAKADFIFLDDHSQTTDWLTIKGALITQLWHAGAGFKSTGYSRFGMPASPAPKSGHRQYTYGIAGSKKIRHFFSEVWGINDEMVLPTGMPRIDEFLNKAHIDEASDELIRIVSEKTGENITRNPNNCRIILFAPTYRGENKRKAYYPYNKLDFKRMYQLCEKTDSIIIFKMHPFVEEPVPIPEEYKDRMVDLTKYENINDIFYITDLLITDYSSNIYEFSLMKKPMLFYAFDIDKYSKERGFHRDYRTNVPGKIVETFDDMIEAIEKKDFEFDKAREYIKNNFEHVDTHACDRIIEWIIQGNVPQ